MTNKRIVGVYAQGKGNFGFVDIEGQDRGYFVHGKNKHNVLPGDKVEAIIKVYKGREEATITRVLGHKNTLIIGKYVKNKNFGFVIPSDPDMRSDIFVENKNSMRAKDGEIVGVKILNWKKRNPEGRIHECLGPEGSKGQKVLSLLLESGIRIKFSDKIKEFTKTLQNPLLKNNKNIKISKQRKNLTDLFTFTIDGEDAKDLDDAISVKKYTSGDTKKKAYKLYVHIADVAYYVQEGSVLDKEAYKRSTSVYLADRVIPMLPEKLSNNLCSLNADTEKLTMTCEIHISPEGEFIKHKVYESIIKSNHRLTYREVDGIISGNIGESDILLFGSQVTKELSDTLKNAKELQYILMRAREKQGWLDFEFPETKICFDDDGEVQGMQEYPKYDSHTMIEHFMVSANEAIARKFSSIPFLYRIHEGPKDDGFERLQNILRLFEINHAFPKDGIFTTKNFAQLLDKVGVLGESKKMFLEKIILRSLSKAIYSHINVGHFGLGLKYYSHFTSPIRRYSDLQIHRIIKEKLHGTFDVKRSTHYKNILDGVSHHISKKEREAEKAEYIIRDYFISQLYKDRVGQKFEGVVSGVIGSGIFVALPDTAEGFVAFQNFDFNEYTQEGQNIFSGKKYRIGEPVEVKLVEIDHARFRLNFEVL